VDWPTAPVRTGQRDADGVDSTEKISTAAGPFAATKPLSLTGPAKRALLFSKAPRHGHRLAPFSLVRHRVAEGCSHQRRRKLDHATDQFIAADRTVPDPAPARRDRCHRRRQPACRRRLIRAGRGRSRGGSSVFRGSPSAGYCQIHLQDHRTFTSAPGQNPTLRDRAVLAQSAPG
jgi:hypothetical protein